MLYYVGFALVMNLLCELMLLHYVFFVGYYIFCVVGCLGHLRGVGKNYFLNKSWCIEN